MNKNRLKSYAPEARRAFIQAVTDRAHFWGLSEKGFDQIEQKGDVAIIGGRPFPLKVAGQRKKLEDRIKRDGFSQVMEAVAYTWFNRFMALRFMEIHDYLEHGFRVLSNRNGSHIPEILEQAAKIDLPGLDKQKVIDLKLDGNKDMELYRMLLVAQCNVLNDSMPFLFERIDDETELLLPDNLLHSDSLIRKLVVQIDEEDWQEVEVIGWLYQFYISEKKDQVIGKVVKSEDIPAATQLFTPNWIVKYMVQNSLGRMWLATYPDSPIRQKMEYYIEPTEQTDEVKEKLNAITPDSLDPELLRLLDPAMGSGHILVEKYDLLKEIYLERGYRSRDIPRLILEKNLYGLDIDDRAAQMAGFALLMKARKDDPNLLKGDNPPKLNLMAIQESSGINAELLIDALLKEKTYHITGEEDLFPDERRQPFLSVKKSPEVKKGDLIKLLDLFKHGKTFGSLITIPEEVSEKLPTLKAFVETNLTDGDMFIRQAAFTLSPLVEQAMILATKYDCVVANPPYMGGKGMNDSLKVFLQVNYPDFKFDLFSAFISRNTKLALLKGQLGFMSPFVWMFIASYEKLRSFLIDQMTITSLVQLEYSGFDGATVPICTFTLENSHHPGFRGCYIRLSDFRGSENQAPKTLEAINNPNCTWFYHASAADFKKIPGSPIAYWLSGKATDLFVRSKPLSEFADLRAGLQTGDNEVFLRFWHEVGKDKVGLGYSNRDDAKVSGKKWFPHNKGGGFRKWYGNNDYLINWFNDGKDLKKKKADDLAAGVITPNNSKCWNQEFYFKRGLSWSSLSSGSISIRDNGPGFLFDTKGQTLFPRKSDQHVYFLALLNSTVTAFFLRALSPTLDYNSGMVAKLPVIEIIETQDVTLIGENCRSISRSDWDSFENSWDFKTLPWLSFSLKAPTMESSWQNWQVYCTNQIKRMQKLETENNRIFIEAYGLRDELNPEVPEDQITLARADREADMKKLISYAIGCMMGRYSLDEPGLVYAHSGNDGFDRSKYRTFSADDDGIIPVTDIDWFPQDAVNRFEEFLKVAWSPETLEENLKFIADSLSPKGGETPRETIRRYISTQFFKDHMQMYKKRPIYWLFSSGKQKAFECLVYLHRYNEATLSRMRNEYVTPLQGKLAARIDYLANEINACTTTSARNKLQKQLDILKKKQTELGTFDDLVRHYADQRISLDLDDGVRVNYGKFGNLLAEVKAVTGSSE